MDPDLFKKLQTEGLISGLSLQNLIRSEENRLFSLQWELRTLLYLGVVLLTGGLGVLVYKNIDTIGHQVILIFIALLCAGCLFYCLRHKGPWTTGRAEAPNPYFDYILLLGCLSFITCIAYLQFEYNFFGTRYGLATAIPLVVLFLSAYYFDHLGILSLAITNLAAWGGIAITPMHILRDNDFDDLRLIVTGVVLGLILVLAGYASRQRNFKKHFGFTYTNFGTHLLFISLLAGLFIEYLFYTGWFLALLGAAYYFYRLAVKQNSFYFLLVMVLYTYIAISYMVVQFLGHLQDIDMGAIYAGFFYFILSAIGVVRILIIHNRKMKTHDSL